VFTNYFWHRETLFNSQFKSFLIGLEPAAWLPQQQQLPDGLCLNKPDPTIFGHKSIRSSLI